MLDGMFNKKFNGMYRGMFHGMGSFTKTSMGSFKGTFISLRLDDSDYLSIYNFSKLATDGTHPSPKLGTLHGYNSTASLSLLMRIGHWLLYISHKDSLLL